MKKFLITIDTEGDNLWGKTIDDSITTENAKTLERFQSLCEEFGFKPTYLTNYEMGMDATFRRWCKPKAFKECEIGMHLHPWNTPPIVKLPASDLKKGLPYVVEYDEETIEKKIRTTTDVLSDVFGHQIISHRAGRWTTNLNYLNVLCSCGYKVDCSFTPHINWGSHPGYTVGVSGSDYSNVSEQPFLLIDDARTLVEIPVTIRESPNIFFQPNHCSFIGIGYAIRQKCTGRPLWFRPNGENLNQLIWLAEKIAEENESDYLMFMLHSSELLAAGSPRFKTNNSIEDLYRQLRKLFKKISEKYVGETLGNYGLHKISMLKRMGS